MNKLISLKRSDNVMEDNKSKQSDVTIQIVSRVAEGKVKCAMESAYEFYKQNKKSIENLMVEDNSEDNAECVSYMIINMLEILDNVREFGVITKAEYDKEREDMILWKTMI
jgi:hypothetical protein